MPNQPPDPRGPQSDYASAEAAKVRHAIQQSISSRRELEITIDHALKRAYQKVRRHVNLEESEESR